MAIKVKGDIFTEYIETDRIVCIAREDNQYLWIHTALDARDEFGHHFVMTERYRLTFNDLIVSNFMAIESRTGEEKMVNTKGVLYMGFDKDGKKIDIYHQDADFKEKKFHVNMTFKDFFERYEKGGVYR